MYIYIKYIIIYIYIYVSFTPFCKNGFAFRPESSSGSGNRCHSEGQCQPTAWDGSGRRHRFDPGSFYIALHIWALHSLGCWRIERLLDVQWCWLDLLCCVIGLLDVSVELVIRNTGRLDEGNPLRGVTVVRVLRIVRVVRVIRIMKFFKELRMMIFSTLNSLQSVVWIFFFLFVLFYMLLVSLIFKQLIQPGVGPGSSSFIERSSFLDYFYAHKPQTINCKILQRHADPLSIPDHSILCLCWLIHCFRQSQVCYYFSGLFTIY